MPSPTLLSMAYVAGAAVGTFAAAVTWRHSPRGRRADAHLDAAPAQQGASRNHVLVRGLRYTIVSTGTTGHAKSVKITYDPNRITSGQLLKIFFAIAHDSTELNRQGPDEGMQYRSSIFYVNDEQRQVATAYIKLLSDAKVFRRPIVTTVVPLEAFYPPRPTIRTSSSATQRIRTSSTTTCRR